MAFATTGERALIDCFTGVAAGAEYFVGLCSASNGTEITVENGYARKTVGGAGGTYWNTAGGSVPATATNKLDISFAASSGAWNGGVAINYAGLFTLVAGGSLLAVIALTIPVTVSATGQTVKFSAGNLTISVT